MKLTKEQKYTLFFTRRALKNCLRDKPYSARNIDFAEAYIAFTLSPKNSCEEFIETKAYIKSLNLFEDPRLDTEWWG